MFSNFSRACWSIRVYVKPFTVDFLWVSSFGIIIYAFSGWPKRHYVMHDCVLNDWIEVSRGTTGFLIQETLGIILPIH